MDMVFFLCVACGSLHTAYWPLASVKGLICAPSRDIERTYIYTHPNHTAPRVCCVLLSTLPRCKLIVFQAMHKPKLCEYLSYVGSP